MSIIGSSKSRTANKSEFFQDVSSVASYSPQGEYFLYLSLAVDKHRLRVYDTGSGKAIAEHVVDHGRITATCWHRVGESILQGGDDGEGTSRKRRKKSAKKSAAVEPGKTALVAVLGLSNGTVVLFSPARNQVVQTVSQAACTAAVLSLAASPSSSSNLWTSNADGSIRRWDLSSSKITGTWQQADRTPYTSIAIRPTEVEDGDTQILAAHHTITLLSLQSTTSPSTTDTRRPAVIATFTGHASSITSLQWDPSSSERFISIAESDRIAQVWKLPSTTETKSGSLVATIPLDSSVRSFGFPSVGSSRTLFALSDSGNLSLLTLPTKLGESTKKGHSHVKTLQAQCAVSVKPPAAGSTSSSAPIVAAQFVEALPGHVNVARVVSMRPIFETVRYAEDDGSFVPEVQLEHEPIGAFHSNEDQTGIDRPRYSDKTAGVRSGAALPEGADFDHEPEGINAELDADMAELTLGQRLKTMRADRQADAEGEGPSDAEGGHPGGRLSGITLTRTLTQALHSNDKQLLETCLQTADERIVKGTVEGLLQQHVIPLLDMLVERLAKGGSGGVGGASTDYASTIVTWIRVALFVHAAFLMTQPDLVKRLASLHATLVARSAMQDRLQMLNGRLDLIFSQLRMRRYDGPASTGQPRRKAALYVEGDSSEEEEEPGMDVDGDVEIEEDDDEGSIEDVELGGLGDEGRRYRREETSDEDEDEDDEDEEDELDEDDSGSDLAGFIDDEAEESEGDGDGSEDVSEEEE